MAAEGCPAAVILIRSALFNLIFFPGSAAAAVLGLALVPLPRRWLLGWIRIWARCSLAVLRVVCGIRLNVIGRERLPRGPAIIAAKHQSAFDTFVWLALLDAPVYVLKQELLTVPVWGWLARSSGHIAVDRAGGAPALRAMVREARARLAEGRAVVIFPEGTRSQPGERVAYHPGVAALAGLGVPVVPAATNSGQHWGRRAFRKQPGTIHLSILPALEPGLPREVLMARLHDGIEAESDRLLGPG